MRIQTEYISKKWFHLARMAPSEWTRSFRAVRDITVAAHSMPSINTTRCVVYCPTITVSPFLLTLSVSYFKQSLSHCGQLWLHLRMGSLGMRLHQDCNALGDAAKTSPHVPSTCVQNATLSLLIVHIIPSHQMYVAIDNPSLVPSISCFATSRYLWNYVRASDNVYHH